MFNDQKRLESIYDQLYKRIMDQSRRQLGHYLCNRLWGEFWMNLGNDSIELLRIQIVN